LAAIDSHSFGALIAISLIAAAWGLPCLLAQSPRHGETGEKDIGVVSVGNDLRREGIPNVLIQSN
jgi:hypothetical protein